jgi:hypothetical protein
MKGAERRLHYYDIEVGTNKQDASPPPMKDVMMTILARFADGKVSHVINKKTATLEIGDMRIDEDEGYALLLVRISDTTAPDAYLSDPQKGTFRIVRKRDGEGRGYGAHLIIALNGNEGAPNTYRALLEKNTGLHRSHVSRLLQAVLRSLYQEDDTVFSCDHVGGQKTREGHPKRVKFRPMLEFTGQPSETLVQELEDGTLKDIALIHNEQKQQLSGRAWLEKQESILKVKVKPNNQLKHVWQNLKAVLSDQAQQGYERARIKFKNTDGDVETIEVDTASGNTLFDDRYVKSRRITDIAPPLDESADAIVEHFAEKLIELLLEV